MSVVSGLNSRVAQDQIEPSTYPLSKMVNTVALFPFVRSTLDCLSLGSLADKAGLFVDDEVLAMNGENIEDMNFDQVRKILKERNLRGSIKLLVRTYEGTCSFRTCSRSDFGFFRVDVLDDNSQTVTTGPPTEHSRTPSPQKPPPMSHSNPSTTTVFTTNSTIRPSTTLSSSASSEPSPVYTFLPFVAPTLLPPPPPLPPLVQPSYSSTPSTDIVTQQTPASPLPGTPSLSIFAPKPFRTSASINLETSHSPDTVSNVLLPF
jgi:PDZ domain